MVNVSDLMDVKEALDDAPRHAMKHYLYGGMTHACEFNQIGSDKRVDDAYETLKTPRGAMVGRRRRPYLDIVKEYQAYQEPIHDGPERWQRMALKIKKHDPSKLGETDRSKYSAYSEHGFKRSATRKFKNKKEKTPNKNSSAPSSGLSSKRVTAAVQDDFKLKKGVDLFGKIATKEDEVPAKKLSKMTPRDSSFDPERVVPYPVKDEVELLVHTYVDENIDWLRLQIARKEKIIQKNMKNPVFRRMMQEMTG